MFFLKCLSWLVFFYSITGYAQVSKEVFLGIIIKDTVEIQGGYYLQPKDSILETLKEFKNNYHINRQNQLTYFSNPTTKGLDTMIIRTNNKLYPIIRLIFCNIIINEEKKDSTTVIDETYGINKIILSPNPAISDSELNLNYEITKSTKHLNILLYSINGVLVNKWIRKSKKIGVINLKTQKLSSGIYIFLVLDENQDIIDTKRLLIK